MTIKEAILKSLENFPQGTTARKICDDILKKGYYTFGGSTPHNTVNAQLGEFISKGDNRVSRSKDARGNYTYYLTTYEENVDITYSASVQPCEINKPSSNYHERDLHPLLITFLHWQNIFAKTIYHEQSNSKNREHQKWLHPDIIGAHFVEYSNDVCQDFFRTTNKDLSIELYSYELKKGISSDYDLKRYYFQAVSNSSWANYGFLVFLEIDKTLRDELERLNDSFGIGAILIKPNPYESRILFPARRKNLDFKTINKLCKINKDFERFFNQIEKVIIAEPKLIPDAKGMLSNLCDIPFKNEAEIKEYCKKLIFCLTKKCNKYKS